MKGKFEILLKGFDSKKTAEEFIDWLCEAGEQDFSNWVDCRQEEGKKLSKIESSGNGKWDGNTYASNVECFADEDETDSEEEE